MTQMRREIPIEFVWDLDREFRKKIEEVSSQSNSTRQLIGYLKSKYEYCRVEYIEQLYFKRRNTPVPSRATCVYYVNDIISSLIQHYRCLIAPEDSNDAPECMKEFSIDEMTYQGEVT